MSVTLDLGDAEVRELQALAAAKGVSPSEWVADLLRRERASPSVRIRVPWPTINTGGLTDAARRLETTKNNFDEELEFGD